MNVDWDHVGSATGDSGLPADPAFPQRERFADIAELAAQLGTPDRSAEVVNVWYIPRVSLQVVYRLRPGDDVLLVRFRPEHRPADAASPTPVVTLPAWAALGWWFPNDPGLPQLGVLGDREALESRLGRIVESSLLSYLPGERCAMRCQLDGGRGDVALKVEHPDAARAASAALERLWGNPDRAFGMPEPLGLDRELGLRWEAFVHGRRLDADLSEAALAPLVPVVARGLAALHRAPRSGLEPLPPRQILDRIERKVLPRIEATLPELSVRARELVRALALAVPALNRDEPVTLHGDLHTANVLADAGDLVFLDLDRVACGNPAFDLALLGGRFLLVALNRGADLAEVARVVAALPAAYEAASGTKLSERDFAWYMAAHLLGRQLRTCIRHWVPRLAMLAPALLEWAWATIEQERFDPQAGPRLVSGA